MRERRDDELRPLSFRRGFTKYAEGSVLVSAGDTRVLCTATVTPGVPRFLTGKGEGWVTAEYGLLPRSTGTRCDREVVKGKQSGSDEAFALRSTEGSSVNLRSRSTATFCRPTAARVAPRFQALGLR